MSDTTQAPAPLKRTVFPFPKRANGNGQAAAEVSAGDYFQALSQAEDGFFPIGYNGQWHGGIHFGAETGASLDQDEGIRCIADGQVIAYRIDGDYPTVDYESCAPATYSRGFVLVRHRLQLPVAPKVVREDGGAATSTQEGEPSLVFFSLYMHLRNWNAYTADPDLKRPAFWDGSVYLVGERAVDSDRARNRFIPESGGAGMNIRDAQHRISGFAPRGVKLKLGDAHPVRSGFYRIMEVVGGTTYPADLAGMYVFKGTDSSAEGLDPVSQPHSTDTVYIPPEPVDIKAGDLVGHLGEYQRYLDMDALAQCASGRPLAQVDVFTHEDLQAFIAQSRARDVDLDARQKTLLHIKPGARLVQPAEPDIELPADQAVVLVPGQGDGRWARGRRGTVAIVDQRPAGFTSATRTYGDGRIFLAAVDAQGNEMTLDEFNALADKATYPRRKLLTPEGDDIWVDAGRANAQGLVTAPSRAWSSFPLQVSNPQEEAVGYSRVVPLAAIVETVEEGDGTRWFQIDAATPSGQSIQGWVRENGHDNVEICSPWAWPGFELLDVAQLEPRDLFARQLCLGGAVQPQERGELESAACNVEQSELFEALGRAVDANGDQEITPMELRNALGRHGLAQAISRMVIRYPSEWSGTADRWGRIDDLIEDEVLRRDWEHEKKRIQDLTFWPDITGRHAFPVESLVHHLHPIGFLENFVSARRVLTYLIYESGSIEKYKRNGADQSDVTSAQYIYVDRQGKQHDFGIFEGVWATRWVRKGTLGTEAVCLVDASNLGANPASEFGFRFTATKRRYLSRDALASLIGALMDVGYDDVTSTGFSMKDGSPGVSSSHINGENGDFRFLRTDYSTAIPTHLNTAVGVEALDEPRQGALNEALYKFGWKTQLAWRYTKNGERRLLPRTVHYAGHHHHLHVGGYSPSLVEE